jgi:tRNA pseudouridine55 synthase
MDGVLIINKAAGMTSHDVVARVRRIIGERRVGHTGTLDPFATGVLVLLAGRATRLAQFLSGAEKEYRATIRLGYATETGDLTGRRVTNVENTDSHNLTDEDIQHAIEQFRGEIDQLPPMYSAKKQQGRRLYELARKGEEVARNPVRVNIYQFETVRSGGAVLRKNADDTCDFDVRVVCSAGTYIRTLAEEVGRSLHTGGHLVALERTRAGDFRIDEALSLDQVQARVAANKICSSFVTTDAALSRLPFVHLTSADAERARHGMRISVDEASAQWPNGANVRMRAEDGNLLAVGTFDAKARTLHPRVVLT